MVANNPAVAKDSSHAEILRKLNKLLREYAQLKASLGLSASAGLKEAIAAVNKPNMTPSKIAHLIRVIKKELESEKETIIHRLNQLLEEEQQKLTAKAKKRELSEAEFQQQLAFYQEQLAKKRTELEQLHQDAIHVLEEAEQAITTNRDDFIQAYNSSCESEQLPSEAQITSETAQRYVESTEEEQQQVLISLRANKLQPSPYKAYVEQAVQTYSPNNSISLLQLFITQRLIETLKPVQAQSALSVLFQLSPAALKLESEILANRNQKLAAINARMETFGAHLSAFIPANKGLKASLSATPDYEESIQFSFSRNGQQ
jgi:hypothetical protein